RLSLRRRVPRDGAVRRQQGGALLPRRDRGSRDRVAGVARARASRAPRVSLGERGRSRGPAAAAPRGRPRVGAADHLRQLAGVFYLECETGSARVPGAETPAAVGFCARSGSPAMTASFHTTASSTAYSAQFPLATLLHSRIAFSRASRSPPAKPQRPSSLTA